MKPLLPILTLLCIATLASAEPSVCPLGLRLPDKIDDTKPLVILIHGIDCNEGVFWRMQNALHEAGYATAAFNYSSDQPISGAAAALASGLQTLHKSSPNLRLQIVAHSMGGLVARDYIESNDYTGGVDRLILIAPPNHGSPWARLEFLARLRQHRRDADDWKPIALVSEPLSAAAKDLLPDSTFLKRRTHAPAAPVFATPLSPASSTIPAMPLENGHTILKPKPRTASAPAG